MARVIKEGKRHHRRDVQYLHDHCGSLVEFAPSDVRCGPVPGVTYVGEQHVVCPVCHQAIDVRAVWP